MFPYNTLYQYHNIWTYNSRLRYNLRITNTSTVATESRLSMPAMPAKTRSKCTMDRQEGNSAMQSLGVHLRRLNEGIKKLQELNINTTLSSLPKYAVVGDQSAGKSSIVQALWHFTSPKLGYDDSLPFPHHHTQGDIIQRNLDMQGFDQEARLPRGRPWKTVRRLRISSHTFRHDHRHR
jgi:hypothetical protein